LSRFGFLHHMVGECSDISGENTAPIFKVTELFQHLLELMHSDNGGIICVPPKCWNI